MKAASKGLRLLLWLALLCLFEAASGQKHREICYDGLGCFSTGGNFHDPSRRPIQLLPESPESIKLTFALYTRQNFDTAQSIVYNNKAGVKSSNFKSNRQTKVIIHGFMTKIAAPWFGMIKKALLDHGDYNVIQLDWTNGNKFPYTQATANTRVVGALLAQLIRWLETEFGAKRETFHLIGHSLGAHIAGYAGERLQDGSRKLDRITGLDPAGPYFENTHPEVRLDPTDARFVDAIHTDGDSLLSIAKLEGGFGLMQPVGHVDFYPNGGKKQPNCDTPPAGSVEGIIKGALWKLKCSHERVREIMISTIANRNGKYKAFPCASYEDFKAGKCKDCGEVGCAMMGMRAAEWNPSRRTNVKMFLDTAGTPPFESP